jgi:hypothetical protein
VNRTLEAWEEWSPRAKESQVLTPFQFLAIALWWASNRAEEMSREFDRTDEEKIVTKWAEKLIDATALRGGFSGSFRVIQAHDEVTRLPIEENKATGLHGWILSTEDAGQWLESMGIGDFCGAFFASVDSPPVTRTREPGTAWKQEDLDLLFSDYREVKVKLQNKNERFSDLAVSEALAERWPGHEPGTLLQQIKKKKSEAKEKPAVSAYSVQRVRDGKRVY